MQRIGNLFQPFCSYANLHLAWRKTRIGSGANIDSALFFQNMEKEIFELQEKLTAAEWRPHPFRYFAIHDPKTRTIAVSTYQDRVVHHALVNVLEPVFEKVFIADSYATRKEKGIHQAVFRARHFLQQYPFFLKSDVDKFFDSVSHSILLEIIARKIKDRKILAVCEKIVRHGGVEGLGLPIGNRTSQFFANVF